MADLRGRKITVNTSGRFELILLHPMSGIPVLLMAKGTLSIMFSLSVFVLLKKKKNSGGKHGISRVVRKAYVGSSVLQIYIW